MQSTLPQNSRRSRSLISSLLVAVVLFGASIYVTLNRQTVLDTLHFWTYHPSSDVSSISQRAGFTDTGTFTFYSVRPSVESGKEFNTNCGHKEQGTAILGCYVSDRIHLFNVTDTRLDGIKEVTAAHEMLHAVYQRLSDSEKKHIDTLVKAEYQKLANDSSYSERMAFYDRNEPGERENELHSIIGTEVADISPELETHYAKYFSNRGNLVKLFKGYNDVFIMLEKQAKSLSAQLDALSKKIDDEMATYNASVSQLNADITDFNRRATSGQFSSQETFNSERSALQRRVQGVSNQRKAINTDISKYEELREEYNKAVTESNNLYKSIDSTLAPAPQV